MRLKFAAAIVAGFATVCATAAVEPTSSVKPDAQPATWNPARPLMSRLEDRCAPDGSPCSDPNNNKPRWPVCSTDCCSQNIMIARA